MLGMRIGQVRVVFSLPVRILEGLFPNNTHAPKHFAYIEWFSRFTPSPEPDTKMYRVRRALKDGFPIASVVPVGLIQRSVHLFPKWGSSVPAEWSSDTVLNQSPSFLLNSFKERHTYFNVF